MHRIFSCVITVALALLASTSAHALVFTGGGAGFIPNGGGTIDLTCSTHTAGPALNMIFPVSGLTVPITTVGVRMMFDPTHGAVGELHVQLAAPGDTPKTTLFGGTGRSAANTFGASSNAEGPYLFADNQTGDWWAAATAADTFHSVPPGGYRTTSNSTGATTSLDAVFAGLTPAQANGTWTLSITDDCTDEMIGGIRDATLYINDAAMPVRLQSYAVD